MSNKNQACDAATSALVIQFKASSEAVGIIREQEKCRHDWKLMFDIHPPYADIQLNKVNVILSAHHPGPLEGTPFQVICLKCRKVVVYRLSHHCPTCLQPLTRKGETRIEEYFAVPAQARNKVGANSLEVKTCEGCGLTVLIPSVLLFGQKPRG